MGQRTHRRPHDRILENLIDGLLRYRGALRIEKPATDSPAITLRRSTGVTGSVHLPGSKSIANRALLLSALASGTTRLSNLPAADDVLVMIQALPLLGVKVDRIAPDKYNVTGTGGPFPVSSASLALENAGTAVRPLVAALAASTGTFIVDGNEQMRVRPIRDLLTGLAGLGVALEAPTGCPPVTIKTTGLRGGKTTLSGKVSSQFISALLLAAPLAKEEDITLTADGEIVSKPYIDLTIDMMAEFGVNIRRDGYREYVVPHSRVYHSP
ncbi:MAG: hypothetical protein HY042_08325, partial [Spirochaetia bacterium]|nr:hypothetical protein [Spirochaetia bacterium]